MRNVQSVLKIIRSNCNYHVQSSGTAAPGLNAHIVFSARTICNPNPRQYGVSPVPNLSISQSCCFFVSPRGAQRPDAIFSEKAPATQQTPQGVFLLLQNHSAPWGVDSHYYGTKVYSST